MIKKQNSKFSVLIASVLCILFSTNIQAQNATDSPYSRFGVGEVSGITFARNLAFGGTQIGLDHPTYLNYGNPAAYGNLSLTTYEGAVEFKQYTMKTTTVRHQSNTASVAYFDFAYPISSRKFGLGFGLVPYSKVGYLVTEDLKTDFGDKESRTYQGSGGLNDFHITGGFKVSKKLSAGVSASYLFGVIENNRTVGFNNPNYFNTLIESKASVGWFHFNTGLQYRMDSLKIAKSDSVRMFENQIGLLEESMRILIEKKYPDSVVVDATEIYNRKNKLAQDIAQTKMLLDSVKFKCKKTDWHLVLGLVASPAANLHARNSSLTRSFRYLSYSFPDLGYVIRDTISNVQNEKGEIRLPLNVGFGFSLMKGNKWTFCSDITWQQWSDFSYLGAKDSLVDSWRTSVGAQYIPKERAARNKFINFMNYRLGLYYEQSFLKLRGENINVMGVTAGFGVPILTPGVIAKLHFTFDYGRRGTTKNNLIEENYFKFTFGFTINDRWFLPTKYD